MSTEQLLATAVSHSPDFDQALALGRIHGILSALVRHCRTRASYSYTGCFTCELQIRSQGGAFVPSVLPDNGVKTELLRAWGHIQGTDLLDGVPIAPSPSRFASEPRQVPLMWNTEPFITPDPLRPRGDRDPATYFLSWLVTTPFIIYFTFKLCNNIYLKILPMATWAFEIFFYFYFFGHVLMLSLMLCGLCGLILAAS